MIWLGCAIVSAVLVPWLVWLLLPERAIIAGNRLLWKHRARSQSLQIRDIEAIHYHYHAVVGFVSVWEFIDDRGNSLTIDGNALGIKQVLLTLETRLPGFSMTEFNRQFESGDVEDSLDVWRRP